MSTPHPLAADDLTEKFKARFWAKVNKTGECWEWTAAKDGDGYGHIRLGRRLVKAHRASLVMAGVDVNGLAVDHICHTPACVRPEHLRTATNKQNGENRVGMQANNTSGVRGVSWDKRAQKWRAVVRHHGKLYAKIFADCDEAAAWAVAKRYEMFTHNIETTIGQRRAERARRARLIAQERARYDADLAMWEAEMADKEQS